MYRLAPITNAAAVFIPLAAVLLLCALSVGVTAVPIAASAFAAGLPDVIRSVIMAGLAAAWSCCLAILLVAAIRKSAEANRAQRIVRALPGSIGSLTLVVPSMVASLKLDRWTPMILLALTAATPWLAVAAARAWTLTISASPSRASAPEPVWGSPGWLRLLCNRTPFLWALAGLVPGLLVVANRMPALVSALLAMLPLLAASHLMEWEHSRPERLALAPDSRRFRLRLIATVSIPLTALALPLLMLAVREPRTIAALTMVAAAAPLTTLVRGRMIRVPLQAAIFITALAIANRAA